MKRTSALLVSQMFLGLGIFSIIALAALFGASLSASAQSPSFVRVIHASPDVGTADVFVDGTKLLSSFQFGAITGYAAIPAGPHKVQIALVGKGVGASVISETLAVSPGVAYTVAAIGTQATGLSLAVFIDNNLLTPGTAKLRLYQLSPNAGSVTVTSGGTTLLSGIGYQGTSNYLSLAAGAYTFTVTSATNNASLPLSATLNASTVTSIFAIGLLNGTPQFQLVSTQAAGLPGMPNTGSDPNAVPLNNMQPVQGQALPLQWTWLVVTASLLLIASGGFIRHLGGKHWPRAK